MPSVFFIFIRVVAFLLLLSLITTFAYRYWATLKVKFAEDELNVPFLKSSKFIVLQYVAYIAFVSSIFLLPFSGLTSVGFLYFFIISPFVFIYFSVDYYAKRNHAAFFVWRYKAVFYYWIVSIVSAFIVMIIIFSIEVF